MFCEQCTLLLGAKGQHCWWLSSCGIWVPSTELRPFNVITVLLSQEALTPQ